MSSKFLSRCLRDTEGTGLGCVGCGTVEKGGVCQKKKKQDGRRLNRVQLDSDSKERKWEVSLGGRTVGQTAIWT